jgi:hypothetical protein
MRGYAGRRSEIMSAFRGLRSSDGHHGALGRSRMTLSRHSAERRVVSVAPITLTMQRRGTNPTDIPRPGPARAKARVGRRARFPRQELSCRLGRDVAAADIDAADDVIV